MAMTAEHLHICPLCEATCGMVVALDGDRVSSVRGDPDDVFSAGYQCPKGVALGELHHDPDRLRTPLVRRGEEHVEVSWEEAFAEADRVLTPLLGDRDALGIYLGNPNVHNLAGQLYVPPLVKALGTRNVFSATTVDQMPKHVAAALMFGDKLSFAVPDIDRTDFLLILGGDPMSSNGSLWTVPDVPGRLRALRQRGGRLIVVDPRRSRTAAVADQHFFIQPGTDALLLFAIVQTLFAGDLVDLGPLSEHVSGIDEVRELAGPFTPELAAPVCRIPADEIRGLARALATAPRAAVYGRVGTCTQPFGTLANWLVDVCNILTGNLDREGGVMFPLAPAGQTNAVKRPGRELRFGRWHSRVRGLPEILGEFPVACLAEEMDAPGEGRIRGLITIAGNPALSNPDSGRMERALANLDALISVDLYLNETTRHAHVILPALSPLERSHYDFAFTQFAIRNTARYSPPAVAPPDGQPDEWEILLRLAAIALGQGPDSDVDALDDFVASQVIQRETAQPSSKVAGADPAAVLSALAPRRGPERLLDFLLRVGPYGGGMNGDGLSLNSLLEAPHGIDLGPLEPRMPEILRTPSGKIELAPAYITADVPRLRESLAAGNGHLVLVGRRHLRSNNSWMHNLPLLCSGSNRCTLQVHPEDAATLGLVDGGRAEVKGAAGAVIADVEVTDAVMPGVVSLPHGWGHDQEGTLLSVARERAGVNSNILADPVGIDVPSGNAVLNAIPVEVSPAS